ncbi:MAG: AAA family ATPase [Bdellovibrionales bacterium]|nr:AAA family ATPase [Bdellovibrionales bacterium]
MLAENLKHKRCLIVCGGGGVGKTTVAASIAIAATKVRDRVLVVTIDPSKRLAEAFGYTIEEMVKGGEPKVLNEEVKTELGVRLGAQLSVGILNPKYVLAQIVEQVLTPAQSEKLKGTVLYQQLSEMVYGLQEYTAYEWVTRMINSGDYDLIILDTPPAFHAKDFFNVPQKVANLMESRVFQLFSPKKSNWFTSMISAPIQAALNFSWIEKLLGVRVFSESRLFFETFNAMRDRILERCAWLSRFFSADEVGVVAVSTIESTAQLELEGLMNFMREKRIPLGTVLINQLEQKPQPDDAFDAQVSGTSPGLYDKWKKLERHQQERAERAEMMSSKLCARYSAQAKVEVIPIPMVYSAHGLEILKTTADALKFQ